MAIKYKLYAKVAFVTAILLFSVGVISFCFILVKEGSLSFDISSFGFVQFFRLFNGPLSFLATSLVVFAAWLTLVRTAQTEQQLELLSENNKFNNYYKHIKEFTDQFQNDPFMFRWFSMTGTKPPGITLVIYREFYYRHPLNFAPRINDRVYTVVFNFLFRLQASSLNKKSFQYETCNNDELTSVLRTTDPLGETFKNIIHVVVDRDSKSLLARLKEKGFNEPAQIEARMKFESLVTIYWLYKIFSSLLQFDGKDDPNLTTVLSNYDNARAPLGV